MFELLSTTDLPLPPPSLYRFRSFSASEWRQKELDYLLNHCGVYCGSLRYFNDPQDSKPNIYGNSKSEIVHFANEFIKDCDDSQFHLSNQNIWNIYFNLYRVRDAIVKAGDDTAVHYITQLARDFTRLYEDTLRCACFTTTYNSASMWNHYANGYRGVVYRIERSETENEEALRLHFAAPGRRYGPMLYAADRPALSSLDVIKAWLTNYFPPTQWRYGKSVYRVMMAAYLTKSTDWLYEEEHRFFYDGENEYSDLTPYKCSEIIVGCKADESVWSDVKKAANSHCVKLFRAQPSTSKYGIDKILVQ